MNTVLGLLWTHFYGQACRWIYNFFQQVAENLDSLMLAESRSSGQDDFKLAI
jgi:hypothetical protein